MFCSVGADSNDYGIMLQRLTDNFNEKYHLDEVDGFIYLYRVRHFFPYLSYDLSIFQI